jgi:hypothetical protein
MKSCVFTDKGQENKNIFSRNVSDKKENLLEFQLKINGPQKIDFKSFGGDISIQALGSVQLRTKGQGSVNCH